MGDAYFERIDAGRWALPAPTEDEVQAIIEDTDIAPGSTPLAGSPLDPPKTGSVEVDASGAYLGGPSSSTVIK